MSIIQNEQYTIATSPIKDNCQQCNNMYKSLPWSITNIVRNVQNRRSTHTQTHTHTYAHTYNPPPLNLHAHAYLINQTSNYMQIHTNGPCLCVWLVNPIHSLIQTTKVTAIYSYTYMKIEVCTACVVEDHRPLFSLSFQWALFSITSFMEVLVFASEFSVFCFAVC